MQQQLKKQLIENKEYKSIVFVAHEFGLYPGHGGIASYLYNICKWLLENTNFNISVIAEKIDCKSDLRSYAKFNAFELHGNNLIKKRDKVVDICKKLYPSYIECAEFRALGLHLVKIKSEGKYFQDTIVVTNNHTATKECYEWSCLKDFSFADDISISISNSEREQMSYSDYCIAPSSFLANYVTKNYNLRKKALVFANPFFNKLMNKTQIINKFQDLIDFNEYKKTFNITLISRFEGRKNQLRLVKSIEKLLDNNQKCRLFLAGNTSIIPGTNHDYRSLVYNSIKPNHIKHIFFYDFMELEAQEKLMAITNLSVMPSTFENQPMAMIETVLRGIPVIGSKYSGIADYSPESMLFDPFDDNSLYNVIKNFINLPEDSKIDLVNRQYTKLLSFIDPQKSILPRFCLKADTTPKNYLNMLKDKI